MRAQGGERFELEGGDLRHGDAPGKFFKTGGDGRSHVPAHDGVQPRRLQNVPDEGDGSRLAVRSRDGDDGTGEFARAQLRLADDRLPRLFEGDGQRMVDGDAGAQDEHVAPLDAGGKLLLADDPCSERRQLSLSVRDGVPLHVVV